MPGCPDDQNCNNFADYILENYVAHILLQKCGLVLDIFIKRTADSG